MTAVEELNLGGVATGEFVMIETDNQVQVGVDNQTNLIPVGKFMMLGSTAVTHLYFQNTSTDNQATVQVVVTD